MFTKLYIEKNLFEPHMDKLLRENLQNDMEITYVTAAEMQGVQSDCEKCVFAGCSNAFLDMFYDKYAVIAVLSNSENSDLFKYKYAVEEASSIDMDYLEMIYARFNGLPLEVTTTSDLLIREMNISEACRLFELSYQYPEIFEEHISIAEEKVSFREEQVSTGEENVNFREEQASTREEKVSFGEEKVSFGEEKSSFREEQVSTGEENVNFREEQASTGEENVNFREEKASTVETIMDLAESYIKNAYDLQGYGMWSVIRKSDSEFIGYVGLYDSACNDETYTLISYYVEPQHRKKGYATKAVEAVLNYAKNILEIEDIRCVVREDNIASKKIADFFNIEFIFK